MGDTVGLVAPVPTGRERNICQERGAAEEAAVVTEEAVPAVVNDAGGAEREGTGLTRAGRDADSAEEDGEMGEEVAVGR